MNRKFAVLAFIGSITLLSACSTPKPAPEETVLAASCCSEVEQLPFYQISNPEFKQVFEIAPNLSPTFNFASGASPFQAVELPPHVGQLSVKVASILENQVFIPYVLVLDSNFNVSKTIDASSLKLNYGKIGTKVYKETSFDINTNPYDASADRYLVMFTKPEQIGKYTEFKSAETIRAEDEGLARPIATDPKLPNGYYGSIELQLKPLTFGTVTKQQQAAGKVSSPSSQKAVIPTSSKSNKTSRMLPESEAFYNKMIESFVNDGEVEKALKLVEEAEYAGSSTARSTFISAIKKQ
ncbi:MalM family protein [Agarivorans aestuarii]|uniref:MalM family protein n=1 Tax=Agarivorans aestuarii TaxID=1563703 RepID=A0ABU7G8A4_9ALTE|nr:MalM family protein [Agarivorans aestuarii]MEE1675629.1 MalM family protein [Agarivorans aestuarii]